MCIIERDGKVVIIDQTAEIERLQGFENAARDLNNDIIRIAGERDELAARIQELEAVLKEADQYRRASLDQFMKIANQRDDLETLNDALMENGNDLRARAQKAEARIAELESQIIQQTGISASRMEERERLQKQIAALQELAEWERASRLRDRVDYETDDEMMPEFCRDARRQLAKEHPEVDWK